MCVARTPACYRGGNACEYACACKADTVCLNAAAHRPVHVLRIASCTFRASACAPASASAYVYASPSLAPCDEHLCVCV